VTTHQQWDIVTSVGITALGVAAARAIETHRDEPMINDPFAARFVRAADPPRPMPTTPEEINALPEAERQWELNSSYLGLRTRFFDEFFDRASAAGIRQVVILASGLDARAFRLRWPAGTTVYEIDQPRVLEFKENVLAEEGISPRCEHRTVPVDLRDEWATALSEAGFDRTAPTAWLAEGLLPYLPPEAEWQLLATIDAFSAPGSRVAIENPKRLSQVVDDEEFQELSRQWGVDLRSLLHYDDRTDASDSLRELGWTVTAEGARQISERYGRELDPVVDRIADFSHFLTAGKA
jgi:methyltransferase (TIGR00027 family)